MCVRDWIENPLSKKKKKYTSQVSAVPVLGAQERGGMLSELRVFRAVVRVLWYTARMFAPRQ